MLPEGDDVAWGGAVDQQTVHMYQQLRKAVVDFVLTTRKPVPHLKYLKPLLIAIWNREKIGVDVVSRLLKNVQLQNERFGPQHYLFDRYLKLILLNCHRLHGLLMIYDEVKSGRIHKFQQYKTRMNEVHESFQQFIWQVGKALVDKRAHSATGAQTPPPSAFAAEIKVYKSFSNPKQRRAHFDDEDGSALRIGKSTEHHQLASSADWCALCSASVHVRGVDPDHIGSKSNYSCLECGYVTLCRQQKFSRRKVFSGVRHASYEWEKGDVKAKNAKATAQSGDRISCWEIWHTLPEVVTFHENLMHDAIAEKTRYLNAKVPACVDVRATIVLYLAFNALGGLASREETKSCGQISAKSRR